MRFELILVDVSAREKSRGAIGGGGAAPTKLRLGGREISRYLWPISNLGSIN